MIRLRGLVCVAALAAVVVLLVPAQAQAQAQFGLKAGIAVAKLRENIPVDGELDGFSTGTGFAGGLFVAIPVSSSFSIQPEALYQKRISKLDSSALEAIIGESVDASVRVDYIEIPVLLKWQAQSGGVRPALFAGPSIGFRMSAKARVSAMGETEEEDLKDEIKSTDFGLVFGAGLGFGRFGIEARYNLGLSNIAEDIPTDASLKWGTWSFLGSVTF